MTEIATQVGKTEEEQMQFVNNLVQVFRDAANAPALRREVETLRAEIEVARKALGDAVAELQLEREEHTKTAKRANERSTEISKLQSKLARYERRFDSLRGIVVAAIEEIEADKRAETETEATKPWTPSTPFRSVS